MYINMALCQVGRYQKIVLGSYAYIPDPMSAGRIPEYRTGVLCIYPGPYVRWEVPRVEYWGPMYISGALCQVGRSQSIVMGSYVYIWGPMSGWMVPEYSNGVPIYISRALWQMGRYQCVVLGPYLYIRGPRPGEKVGRSQSIVQGSYVYILGPLSGGKVPE